jgi:hypothetical protein
MILTLKAKSLFVRRMCLFNMAEKSRTQTPATDEKHLRVSGHPLITDIFYPQMSQICADFFESRLLGAGRPVCLRFPVASLVFGAFAALRLSGPFAGSCAAAGCKPAARSGDGLRVVR